MKEIQLTKGQITLVDDEDYERLSKFKWYARKSENTFYATRRVSKYGRHIHMHRDILNLNDSMQLFADHEDHNGLNNQKYNLRKATRSQNNANRIPIGASKYLGVFPSNSKTNPWFARIIKDGQRNYLGSFTTKEAAALAYNNAAIIIHGEFANLNNIETASNIYGNRD